MKLTTITAILILGLNTGTSFGAANQNLADHFNRQITDATSAFEKSRGSDSAPMAVDLKRIYLGLAPSVSFGLNDVLSLSVTPELTLVWEKTEDENR